MPPLRATPSAMTMEQPIREVPIAWEALEEAFYNNSPSAHSYLHLATGCVLRIVDGVDDPGLLGRVATDAAYLRIEPVSSSEQFRWMARYTATVEDTGIQRELSQAIGGRGAFRQFKDVITSYPDERARWFAFRSARLRSAAEAWLQRHALHPVAPDASSASRRGDSVRAGLCAVADTLHVDDLAALTALAAFLKGRVT